MIVENDIGRHCLREGFWRIVHAFYQFYELLVIDFKLNLADKLFDDFVELFTKFVILWVKEMHHQRNNLLINLSFKTWTYLLNDWTEENGCVDKVKFDRLL